MVAFSACSNDATELLPKSASHRIYGKFSGLSGVGLFGTDVIILKDWLNWIPRYRAEGSLYIL